MAAAEHHQPESVPKLGTSDALTSVHPPRIARKTVSRPARNVPTNWTLVLLFAIVTGGIVLSTSCDSFDNDMWWLLATGREIVENGIPHTNPWSMHDGLEVVVQQWLASVILYGTYSLFGFFGLKFLTVFQSGLLALILYLMCRITSGFRRGGGEVFAFGISIATISLVAYLSVRPHVYSMALYALVIAVLELYRLTHRQRWLALLPLLTCIHVNLHASMAPFDLFIIVLYLVPDIPRLLRSKGIDCPFSFFRMGYKRVPLLVALFASAIAMLVNPYGVKGALYLVLSYGAADYGNFINEMGLTSFWTSYGGAALTLIVLGSMAIGHNGHRRIDVPLTILFAVCIPLAVMHTRNEWLVSLFALPLMARSFGAVRLNMKSLSPVLSNKALNGVLALVLAVGSLAYVASAKWPTIVEHAERDTTSTPSAAMDYLDEYTRENIVDRASLRIYNSFNSGGYVEWRGYKVFMDPRPELWEPGITGVDTHYYQEFVDFSQDAIRPAEIVSKYDFDFLVVDTGTDLSSYLAKGDGYTSVLNGIGYQVWTKK